MLHLCTCVRRNEKILIVILVLLQFSVKVQSQIRPGPATEIKDQVTFWDFGDFKGNRKLSFPPDDEAKSVDFLVDRISSVEVPRGMRVKLFDGSAPNERDSRFTYLYPGNYPFLGGWQDKTNFVLIERIPLDAPVAYFYDEEQDVGTERLRLFHGLGLEGIDQGSSVWDVNQLLCNDCFESVHVTGLIEVTVYEAANLNRQDPQRRQQTYNDPDGLYPGLAFKANPYVLPGGLFDEVSSIRIRKRTDAFPARIESLTQQNDNSDYFATLNFSVASPTQGLCLCGVNFTFNRRVAVDSDNLLAPVDLTVSNLEQENIFASWNETIQVPLGPGQQDVSLDFFYDSGFKDAICLQTCGYAKAEGALTVSTPALKPPNLDSFLVSGNGQIELFWTKLSDVPDDQITTYIKRDGQTIATLAGEARSFTTDDFPGSGPYDYTIEIEAFDQTATSEPLKVYPPVGIFTGTVATRPGGLDGTITGVRNVEVCAIQENDLPGLPAGTRYCDTTDDEGNYRIEKIYFGEEGFFMIEPSKSGHGFDPEFRSRSLTPQISIERNVNFTDTTSFIISGLVVQPGEGTTCPGGNVEILINGQFLGDKTDAEGNFVISIPQAGTFLIQPRLADHTFDPAEVILQVDSDFAGILFEDTTLRMVSGYVRAGCEQFIGQAQVRFLSPDECLDTTITTSPDSGYFEIELPARRYDVEVLSIDLSPDSELDEGEVVGFLARQEIDLTERDTLLTFTYRQVPKIQISGLDDPECTDLPFPIIEQLEKVQLEIEVWEEVGVCPVDTGFLLINDRISVPNKQEIKIPIQNGIARYTFEATEPRIDPPYTKNLSLTADVDGRFSDEQIEVIVVGVRAREKTFATVTPELPLLILRDPPGDASSSYLQQNAILQTATSFSTLTNESNKTWANVKAGTKFEVGFGYTTEVKVWGDIGGSATVSASTRGNEEFLTSLTTGERFSTSNQEIVTGTEGDVFMGAALNMIYALADEIRFNPSSCSIEQDTTLIMGNDGFATTYIYTEDHIRNTLIPQLNQLIVLNREINPDTAVFFQNQASVWEQTLQRNEELKRKAKFVENRSFSGNAPYEAFTSSSSTEKITIEYTDVIDEEVAIQAGLEIAGVGLSGGRRYNFRMETGKSETETQTQELRTGFILNDDDQGDFFSVDIKADPVYNTPVFDLVSGRSSCPFEPGTQPREGAQLEAVDLVKTNVDPDDEAVFRLLLSNTSQSEESRIYQLKFNQASNPDGATIKVGGSEVQGPINYTIRAGEPAEATMTVERGPEAYSYPNLEFLLVSFCDTSIRNSIKLSAYFQSECSPITLRTDEVEWIVDTEDEGMQSIRIIDYEKNNLDRVIVQYASLGDNNWQNLSILQPGDLSDLPGGTDLSLDLGGLEDGQYQLRAKLTCNQGFVYSESVAGRIDRTPPGVFGQPEPSNDEYTRGQELSVTFDEPINCLFITSDNVQLRRASDNTLIPTSVGCADNKLLFRPDQDLFTQFGATYTIEVRGVEDSYGNQITEPIEWSFTIGGDTGEDNLDFDADGVLDEIDNCVLAANTTQRDMDEDDIGDACDGDIDGDGIDNQDDNAPYIANPDQADTDGNGIGDVAESNADGDQDSIPNQSDNCRTMSNPDQSDIDGDGIGDVCDDDMDGDGILNTVDNCPTLPNSLQEDADNDGIGDNCEGLEPVSTDETLTFQHFHIYPNPTRDILNVELEPLEAGTFTVELYNTTGQSVQHLEIELIPKRTTFALNVDQLPKGMYLLMLSDGSHSIGKRILVW